MARFGESRAMAEYGGQEAGCDKNRQENEHRGRCMAAHIHRPFLLAPQGVYKIETEGDYTFSSSADDNTKVWIDGQLAIIQVYSQPGWNIGPLHLAPGYHEIRLEFMESYGNNYFTLSWSGPGFCQQPVPEAVFFRSADMR